MGGGEDRLGKEEMRRRQPSNKGGRKLKLAKKRMDRMATVDWTKRLWYGFWVWGWGLGPGTWDLGPGP